MAKLLFIVIGLFVAYWILKSYKKKVERRADKRASLAEDMVRCAQCGVHLPKSESLTSGNAFYCSAEHRRLHDKTG
ncbi:MAG TPA: PP0621 family protein [Burkholderiales bacterium]|nr:PP0621 family protein [Burkholderiales bacterium]